MTTPTYDVAIIGSGIAGMATALRLQAKGFSTVILEAHGQPGGCAGFFKRKGFAFDVGATTLVDFGATGVGGELFTSTNIPFPEADLLDYKLWLPDREVVMYHDKTLWNAERLAKFGNTPNHIAFWKFLDHIASVFWNASRNGIKLPLQSIYDVLQAMRAVGVQNIFMARYLHWTLLDAMKKFNLQNDVPLRNALGMLVEDTVHSTIDKAPLINAALGITIRGAGLQRAQGGMKGLWEHFTMHYKRLGGRLVVGNKVSEVSTIDAVFYLRGSKGIFQARKVVSAIPAEATYRIVPDTIQKRLDSFVKRDAKSLGGAIVVFLGVPEEEVINQPITHHQLLQSYNEPFGNGNNMFISVSSSGDIKSAPAGYRAVMLSTHCPIQEWEGLTDEAYEAKKESIGNHLLSLARRVYPDLGRNAVVYEVGTPRTYHKYTGRPQGAVGGVRQTFENSNLNALPHNIGVPNFWLAGDSTWPGLGTVACILGSRIVADQVSG
ncbi:phytoene desaturase family protein [Ohtaekwangia kribbensis]|uniref:Phytoene desaturase family protein n=1 Tax=Ohtaekwangia kribbensis TaxID=688913 RepID=A0ABW3KBG4_9BACT